jgi:hypothetical protein
VKKTLVPAAALALSLMTVGVGLAQAEEPANCADAITTLQRADSDHRAAVAADDKLADAVDADERLKEAQDARDDAQRNVAPIDTVTAARTERDKQQAIVDNRASTGAERRAAEEEVAALNIYIRAEQDLTRAKNDADDVNVVDARREADKTNAGDLKKALDEARADFNRICINKDDPTDDVTTTPATPAPAPDVHVTVVAPRGGVNTGGGPA